MRPHTKISIIFADIGNYHLARLRAAQKLPDVQVRAIEVFASSEYDEFRADSDECNETIRRLALRTDENIGAIRRRLVGALDQQDPDVVAVPGWSVPYAIAAICWAKKRHRRLIVMSESQAEDGPRSRVRESVKARIVQLCDAALVGGVTHRDLIVALGMAPERVSFGYDAVDNAHFTEGASLARSQAAELRASLGLPPRYLLASARFVAKKNLPRLIVAYAAAVKSLTNAPHLVILGDGIERPSVELAIAQTGVANRVHLVGFQNYKLLPAFYGLSEGLVHVSTSEQWGLVANEAAAAGLPLIVAVSCGAAKHLVEEGKNGYLVDPFDVSDITVKIRQLATLSSEERSAMGRASQRMVANWGPERFANGMAAACDAALSMPTRRLALWDALLLEAVSRRAQA